MTAAWAAIATGITLGILATLAWFAFRSDVDAPDKWFRGDDDLPDGWA